MSARRGEQRNRYKGFPPRPWISVQIRTHNGRLRTLQLVADTGNPVELIVGTSDLAAVVYKSGRDHHSNFGPLRGGWLQLAIPELRFTAKTPAYGNDAVLAMVRASSADF